MFVLCGVLCALAALGLSLDDGCSIIGEAAVAALAVAIADGLAGVIARRAGRRWTRLGQLVLLLAAAGVMTLVLRLVVTEATLFEQAMGMRPSAGVRQIAGRRYYAGGPGDRVILLRFTCDRQTAQAIRAARPFVAVPIEEYPAEVSPGFWWHSRMGLAASFDRSWARVPALVQPQCYEWQPPTATAPADTPPPEHVTFIWDAETGQAFVLYTLG